MKGTGLANLGFPAAALIALVVVGILFEALLFYSPIYPGKTLQETAQVAQIVSLLSVIVAFSALIYASHQVRIARYNQTRNFAEGLYRDYLKLAFENPVLADPTDDGLGAVFKYEGKEIDYTDKATGKPVDPRILYARYEWFLSFVLDACEQLSDPRFDGEFDKVVRTQLGYHQAWLEHQFGNDSRAFGQFKNPGYIALIREVVDDGKKNSGQARG